MLTITELIKSRGKGVSVVKKTEEGGAVITESPAETEAPVKKSSLFARFKNRNKAAADTAAEEDKPAGVSRGTIDLVNEIDAQTVIAEDSTADGVIISGSEDEGDPFAKTPGVVMPGRVEPSEQRRRIEAVVRENKSGTAAEENMADTAAVIEEAHEDIKADEKNLAEEVSQEEEKPKRRRRRTTKKAEDMVESPAEEVKATEPCNVSDEAFAEAVNQRLVRMLAPNNTPTEILQAKFLSQYTDEKFEALERELNEELEKIRVEADMNPGTLKYVLSDLDKLYSKLFPYYQQEKKFMDAVLGKDYGAANMIRYDNSVGSNEYARRAAGYRALTDIVLDGEHVNFLNVIIAGNIKFASLEALRRRIESKYNTCITVASAIKTEEKISGV